MLLQCLLQLTQNKKCLDLVIFKYSLRAIKFYKHCLNARMDLLEQTHALLIRMFDSALAREMSGDKEYKKFKKETVSLLLLNLYKASLIDVIAAFILKSDGNMKQMKMIWTLMHMLPLILRKHTNVNLPICDLIYAQLQSVDCLNVILSMHRLIKMKQDKHMLHVLSMNVKFATEMIHSLQSNLHVIIAQNADMYRDIISFLLTNIGSKIVFDFIAFSALNQRAVQDIFDKKLIEQLCKLTDVKGENVVFPALIGVSLNHCDNLKVIAASALNVKHLYLWLKKNMNAKRKKGKQNQFIAMIPAKMWSNCLQFYS